MKKWLSVAIAVMVLLSGCAPSFKKQEEIISGDEKKQKAIIPHYQISKNYYKNILPFRPGKARGMVVSNINTRYDIVEFETGLMRIAQENFSPEKYLFQEGQYLDEKTISSWLKRKYTDSQLKEKKLKPSENLGLNPIDDEKGSIEDRNKNNPIYLAHIMEHNYLMKSDDQKILLKGAVIGLALNSIHYYQKEKYGATFDVELSQKKVEEEGKKIAQEVANRLRERKEFKSIPITIALFQQEGSNSVVPGHFFAYTHLDSGQVNINGWEKMDERYYLFPSPEAEKDHRDDITYFFNFKQDVEKYFQNYNGVIGRAFYKGDQLSDLKIEIPIQFYGKAESIGFTQFVTGLILEHFPAYIPIEVSITSVNGPEALIVKKQNEKEPFVHIYH
ncbi:protein involved in sex pheromone biosynthesis [Oikeobacillus pervagus]|uniref:Protein involved in sex pheromone biosynthesis n=1 Tax=Oikeobacillus pervagus TaxID=1325931 RepID=A0AAJ1T2E0_9BACI|nr:CamS family sex pheromone protein [Oikeobacillus pervagus]MDQ0215542.1 protein involved in sex pheromone biosynthesis [Oikeobacillus pervagus]